MGQFASHEAAEKVHDLDTFLSFLKILLEDWEEASTADKARPSSPYSSMYGWENTSIGSVCMHAIDQRLELF